MLADRIAGREASRADGLGHMIENTPYGRRRSHAGVTVGVERALGLTAWWSGVRYLAETVASLPAHSYRDHAEVRSRRADPPWMAQPDDDMPWFALIEFWMMSLLHRGNAYAFKVRNLNGQVIGLRPLHPDRVRVGKTDGVKVFRIDGDLQNGYTSREILHIPGLSYDGVLGLDPLRVHADSLGVIAAADEFAGRFFGQGDHTRAYISVPEALSDDEAKATKAQWQRFHSGMMNAHELGVLGNGATYNTVGLDPEQTQLLETRRFGVTEVARILRVVPHKLYDLERATFSNIEHQSIEAVVDGVRPWVVRIEAFVNFDPDLMPGPQQKIEFNIDGLLRGDMKTRYEAYSSAVGRPWMSGNEARRFENQAPVAGLDEIAPPANASAAAQAADTKEAP